MTMKHKLTQDFIVHNPYEPTFSGEPPDPSIGVEYGIIKTHSEQVELTITFKTNNGYWERIPCITVGDILEFRMTEYGIIWAVEYWVTDVGLRREGKDTLLFSCTGYMEGEATFNGLKPNFSGNNDDSYVIM